MGDGQEQEQEPEQEMVQEVCVYLLNFAVRTVNYKKIKGVLRHSGRFSEVCVWVRNGDMTPRQKRKKETRRQKHTCALVPAYLDGKALSEHMRAEVPSRVCTM